MKMIAGIFVLCLYSKAFSQNTIGLPQIINYTKNDFRAGVQTWDAKQDSRGVMYFANNDGLLSFDGSYWRLYTIPNKTILRSLFIDSADRIYVGAQNEMGYFTTSATGNLYYVSLKKLIPASQQEFADIWDIEAYGESVFFRATDRIFELKNNSISVYTTTSEWRFLKKVADKLYAQDKNSGLLQYKNNGWFPVGKRNLLNDQLISGLISIGKDSMLVTTLKNGLYILYKDSLVKKRTAIDDHLQKNQIYAASLMNNKEFVAGTTSDGCVIMNFDGEVVQKIANTEGLQNNNVLCLFLDKNKNLWTGLNNGISFIAYNSAIKYIRPSKANELSGYSTRIFNNKLYIATSDGTHMVSLNGTNSDLSFNKGDFSQIKNSTGQVWRLDEVNQQLLMGYNEGGYVIRNDEAFPITTGKGAWLFVPTSTVYPSKNVLVGTYSGLQMFDFSNNSFSDKGRVDGIYESFRFLAIDNNNEVWSSHPYRGIFKLQLSADQKSYSAHLYTAKDGLPSTLGNYAFRIKNNVVFATEKGVYEYDASTDKFNVSPTLGKIFGEMEVRYLNEDADGNIWFCSGKKPGVVHFEKGAGSKFTITYFPELTGQVLTGFENIYPYNKENIFIGSEKGVIHLDYEKYLDNKSTLTVLLRQVKAFGSKDSVIAGANFAATGKKNTVLSHRYNSFHFEFSSPAFGLQNNIEYSYRLEGYDAKWSEWSAKTEKDYTNLSSGKYSFLVKAHDNLGNESETVLYSFEIEAAWYRTNLAWIIYSCIFIYLLYRLYKYQQKKLHLQQVKFDEEQKRLKYIHQLELETNEKEIIKLQNEKLATEMQLKNRELADATLHLVERSDALAKVKEELQRLYKNTGNNHDVKKTIQFLTDVEKNNSNWEQFASHFDEVNNDFLKKLKSKYPNLSSNDLKVCAYLQLNLSTKEIAQLMNISVRGVEISRYRLRKKLGIATEQSLNDFLNNV